MELGVLLIPGLILLSGAIALVGNAVGRTIGRRRLTLFGLRPRHTAQVITVITGMLITVTTLLVVLLLSREARVALFRLNAVLQETHRLEADLKKQEDRLKQLALGDIAYLNNQEVVRDVIDGRLPPDQFRQRVQAVRERATELARENGIGVDSNGNALVLTPPNLTWEDVADLVGQRHRDTVLRLVASQNTLRGEPLMVFVQLFDNTRVYAAKTVLVSAVVDGQQSREAIALDLLRLADQAARQVRGKVLSQPFTIVTAVPNAAVDLDNHRAAVTKIQRAGGRVRVEVVAAQDIYTVGPLAVTYRVLGR